MDKKILKYFKSKKILITGHTGFKGAWLCIVLKHLNAKVYGISLKAVKNSLFEKAKLSKKIDDHNVFDIRDKKRLSKKIFQLKPDIIIHLAAQSLVLKSYENPFNTFEVNFNGTLNLINAFIRSKLTKKILVVTTDKVYKNKKNTVYKENDQLWGIDPYSASKVAVEQLIYSYNQINVDKNKHFLVARAGNVLGGGDIGKDRIIPDILRAIKNNKVMLLRSPNSIRPWQHVLDPLFGYLTLIYKSNKIKKTYAWNFGPKNKNFKKVIDIVNKFKLNYKLKTIIKKNFNKETNVLKINSEMTKKKLNWFPKLNFNKSLDYTISYEKLLKQKKEPYEICLHQIQEYIKDR
jgi:CDP-glucose 4,6-dehydratase|tara:strand:- start:17 stop:1060 length:1044 start_codon:yes stop_codon:yes gene_type:complete